jgi:hypothetical protein
MPKAKAKVIKVEDPASGKIELVKTPNKIKFAALVKKIKSGKYWVPKVGDYVYTNTRISFDHGEDDVCGGLSTVTKVYESMSGGDAKCKFIEIAEHQRGGNWTQFLFEDQAELMKEFGKDWTYLDPDYNNYDEPGEWH